MRHAAFIMLFSFLGLQTGNAETGKLYIIDGDTIRVDGESVRLMGFNTPETRFAKCDYERKLGYQAKEFLSQLIKQAQGIELVYKTKKNGKKQRDRYQRFLAQLLIDGQDVAGIMISKRLAEPYRGGKRRNWCK